MIDLRLHVVAYVVGTALFVAVWLVAGGDATALGQPLVAAREEGFWPFWVALFWGIGLVAHVGIRYSLTGPVRRWRTRRRERRDADGPRLLAAMFTDLDDSTGWNNRVGDDAWADLLSDHRRTVRAIVDDCGGNEVGTQGDGFLVTFPSPSDAVTCAVELLSVMDGRDDVPRLRVGIHAGRAVATDDDVIGRMINLAARVADHAQGSQVLLTESVADHLDPAIALQDLGLVDLKGFARPRHLFRLD